jgi:hypothetical protein
MRSGAGLLLALLVLGVAPLRGAEDGGEPLAFSKLPVGARPAAMGNASGALGGDAYGFIQNPALLGTLSDIRLGSQLASLALGSSQQFVSVARPFDSGGGAAYGLAYHRTTLDQAIEMRDSNTPDPEGTFSDSASILTGSVSDWIIARKLSLGVSVKVLAESLGDASAGGFSGDAGLFMHAWPWLDLGLTVQDFTSRQTWNTGTVEDLPVLVRSSAVVRAWQGRLLISGNVEKSEAQDLHVGLGTEFWVCPQLLALRAGWDQGQWSAGFGLQTAYFGPLSWFSDGGLDYAISGDPLGDGSLQHRLSLDLGFSLD